MSKQKLTYKDEDEQVWDESFVPWKFGEPEPNITTEDPIVLSYVFWDGQFAQEYKVEWSYDSANNQYLRNNAGQPHIDLNTDKQLTTKNIVVVFMLESRANDGYEKNQHLLYRNIGTGKAKVFKDGAVIEATWSKKTRTGRTVFKDAAGMEIEFNPGLIWISILPTGTVIEY